MSRKEERFKDDIYYKKKEISLMTQSFLAALDDHLEYEIAFKIALSAFTKYMIETYKKVLASTKKGSQERFDRFRKFYEDYASKTSYLEIIESTSSVLIVKYNRCPFFEILEDLGLKQYGKAFCLSDPAFTKILLPGVKFSRTYEIATGGPYCNNTWKFINMK